LTDSLKNLDIESQELLWIDCCETAAGEFRLKHLKTADEYWQEALNITGSFPDNDPRHAASINNMGVICRFRNKPEAAEKYYQSAKLKWVAAADWVSHMEIKSRAASSRFHLRMERRHRETYNEPLINEYLNKLDAGYAATLNNHAELLFYRGNYQQARAQYTLALDKRTRAGLSADNELRAIEGNLHRTLNEGNEHNPQEYQGNRHVQPSPLNFMDRARREKWIIDKPPVFTDEGRLMAAILFTHVISPEPVAEDSV